MIVPQQFSSTGDICQATLKKIPLRKNGNLKLVRLQFFDKNLASILIEIFTLSPRLQHIYMYTERILFHLISEVMTCRKNHNNKEMNENIIFFAKFVDSSSLFVRQYSRYVVNHHFQLKIYDNQCKTFILATLESNTFLPQDKIYLLPTSIQKKIVMQLLYYNIFVICDQRKSRL